MSHYLRLRGENGYSVRVDFECDAPVGALCRLVCPESCEEHCDHEPKDYGKCVMIEWLHEGGSDEAFIGDDETPLSDGMKIDLSWGNECVEWDVTSTSQDTNSHNGIVDDV